MPWPEDIVTLLISGEVVTELGVDVFETTHSGIPFLASGAVVTVVEYGGTAPEYIQNGVLPAFLKPTAQVVARASDADAARIKAVQAWSVLTQVRNTFVNGNWYRSIKSIQSQPFDGGVDDRGQSTYKFNVIGDFNSRESF